jgi:hypothetical protein
MRLRAAFAALLLGTLALVAGGCGSASLEGVAEAASKTASASSVHFSMTLSQSVAGGQPVVVKGSGGFDGPAKKLAMSMDMSGMAAAFGGGLAPGGFEVEAVMDGLVMYLRLPLLDAMLPAGKRWVSMDLAKIGEAAGVNVESLMSVGGNDPRRMLEYLRSATDLEEAGEDTVRGVATTRYRGTLDLQKAIDALPAEQRAAASAAMGLLKQAGLGSVPVQAWVDLEGYVRRIRQTYAYELGGMKSSASLEFDYFGFGQPVDVTVPHAAETVDVSSLGS